MMNPFIYRYARMLLEIVAALGVRGDGSALYEQPPICDVGGESVLDEKYGYALLRGTPGRDCGVPSGNTSSYFDKLKRKEKASRNIRSGNFFLCLAKPPRSAAEVAEARAAAQAKVHVDAQAKAAAKAKEKVAAKAAAKVAAKAAAQAEAEAAAKAEAEAAAHAEATAAAEAAAHAEVTAAAQAEATEAALLR